MTPLDVLRQGREIISDPIRWTTGEYARDSAGRAVLESSPDAVCWCSSGVIRKLARSTHPQVGTPHHEAIYQLATTLMLDRTNMFCIHQYQDLHGHKTTLELWDKTITRLEQASV